MRSADEISGRCKLVEDYIERREEGLALSAEELKLLDGHLDECPECRLESAALDLMGDRAEGGTLGPLDELGRRRVIDEAIFLAQSVAGKEAEDPGARRHSALRAGFVAAGLAAAAAVLLVVWFQWPPTTVAPKENPLAEVSVPRPAIEVGLFEEIQGLVKQDGARVAPGDAIEARREICTAEGDAIVGLKNRARLWIQGETCLRVDSLEGGADSVDLTKGAIWAEVDPNGKGTVFRVVTSAGEVEVLGTIFRVTSSGGGAGADVIQGAVKVKPKSASEFRLESGFAASLLTGEKRALTASELQSYKLELEARSLIAYHQSIIGGGSDIAGSNRASDKAPQISPPGRKPAPDALSKSTLLAQIRALRLERDWLGAASTYEKLIKRHWGSEEANASMVALGQLRLEKLSDPAGALGSFESYLGTGSKDLAAEAMFGKARAFRNLGDLEREQKALSELISRFPASFQSKTARRRLQELWSSTQE